MALKRVATRGREGGDALEPRSGGEGNELSLAPLLYLPKYPKPSHISKGYEACYTAGTCTLYISRMDFFTQLRNPDF